MSEHDKRSPPAADVASAVAPMFSKAAWARILPFLVYIFFIFAVDMLTRLGLNVQDLRWLYAVKVGAVLLTLVYFWRQYTELHTFHLSPMWVALSVGVGLLVFVLWINLSADWMVVGSAEGFDPRTNGQIDWLMVAVRIAGAALVVPVMEELFWRSFLMRWIEDSNFASVAPSAVKWSSVAITVVLFGFEHNLWLAGIVAGVAYSILYMRQGALWSAILAHAVTNGVLGLWIVRSHNWTYW